MKNYKNFAKQSAALAFVAVILAACAATIYKVDSQTYTNREEARAAWTRRFAEAEAAIPVGSKQLVDRKVLVVIPTASAISRTFEGIVLKRGKPYAQPGTPARAQDDFNADALAGNFNSVASSLKKANIYREVDVMSVDSTTSNIQPSQSQDVITFYIGVDNAAVTTYFLSAKSGKQVVAIDTGRATIAERRKSMIDDIKAKALQ